MGEGVLGVYGGRLAIDLTNRRDFVRLLDGETAVVATATVDHLLSSPNA